MVNIGYILKNLFVSAVLVKCFFEDIKYRKIHIFAPVICIGILLGADILSGTINIGSVLLNMIPGLVILVIAVLKKEMIGAGDGLIMMMTGLIVDNIIFFVMISFGIAIVHFVAGSIICYVKGRTDGKKEIPFVPCICIAYLLTITVDYMFW